MQISSQEDGVLRIDIGVLNSRRPDNSTSKLETTIADILSKYECLKRSVSKGGFHSGSRADPNRVDPNRTVNPRDKRAFVPRGVKPPSLSPSDWRSNTKSTVNESWGHTGGGAIDSSKRPKIGSADPGLRAITALLNKINASNFDTIKTQVVKLVADGGVDVKSVIDALLEKSASDGDGFTMAYAKLLASIAEKKVNADSESAPSALHRISDFLHEIYGSGDALWNEIVGVADATVRFKPTDNYDGFCSAIKAKKRIFGRHRTAISILTLLGPMGDEMSSVPKPSDAVAKLTSLMKRAVGVGQKQQNPLTYYDCLNEGVDVDADVDNTTVDHETATRESGIEIVLELVSQLSNSWVSKVDGVVIVKKEFVTPIMALKSGLNQALTGDIIASCGPQCRFRSEFVVGKLAEFAKSVTPVTPVTPTPVTPTQGTQGTQGIRTYGSAVSNSRTSGKAWQINSSGEAVKAALRTGRPAERPPTHQSPQTPYAPKAAQAATKSYGGSWRSII